MARERLVTWLDRIFIKPGPPIEKEPAAEDFMPIHPLINITAACAN